MVGITGHRDSLLELSPAPLASYSHSSHQKISTLGTPPRFICPMDNPRHLIAQRPPDLRINVPIVVRVDGGVGEKNEGKIVESP